MYESLPIKELKLLSKKSLSVMNNQLTFPGYFIVSLCNLCCVFSICLKVNSETDPTLSFMSFYRPQKNKQGIINEFALPRTKKTTIFHNL